MSLYWEHNDLSPRVRVLIDPERKNKRQATYTRYLILTDDDGVDVFYRTTWLCRFNDEQSARTYCEICYRMGAEHDASDVGAL